MVSPVERESSGNLDSTLEIPCYIQDEYSLGPGRNTPLSTESPYAGLLQPRSIQLPGDADERPIGGWDVRGLGEIYTLFTPRV